MLQLLINIQYSLIRFELDTMISPSNSNSLSTPHKMHTIPETEESSEQEELHKLNQDRGEFSIHEEDELDDLMSNFLNTRRTNKKYEEKDDTQHKSMTDNSRDGLLTELDVFSDSRLRLADCWKYLTVHVYRQTLNQTVRESEKTNYYLAIMCLDLFCKYSSCKSKTYKFYLLTKETTILFGCNEGQ